MDYNYARLVKEVRTFHHEVEMRVEGVNDPLSKEDLLMAARALRKMSETLALVKEEAEKIGLNGSSEGEWGYFYKVMAHISGGESDG